MNSLGQERIFFHYWKNKINKGSYERAVSETQDKFISPKDAFFWITIPLITKKCITRLSGTVSALFHVTHCQSFYVLWAFMCTHLLLNFKNSTRAIVPLYCESFTPPKSSLCLCLILLSWPFMPSFIEQFLSSFSTVAFLQRKDQFSHTCHISSWRSALFLASVHLWEVEGGLCFPVCARFPQMWPHIIFNCSHTPCCTFMNTHIVRVCVHLHFSAYILTGCTFFYLNLTTCHSVQAGPSTNSTI